MCSFASTVIIFYMNKRIGIFTLILSSLIGFSRLYLYVHYPSDVFCGMVIGILLGIASIIIVNNIEKAKDENVLKNKGIFSSFCRNIIFVEDITIKNNKTIKYDCRGYNYELGLCSMAL